MAGSRSPQTAYTGAAIRPSSLSNSRVKYCSASLVPVRRLATISRSCSVPTSSVSSPAAARALIMPWSLRSRSAVRAHHSPTAAPRPRGRANGKMPPRWTASTSRPAVSTRRAISTASRTPTPQWPYSTIRPSTVSRISWAQPAATSSMSMASSPSSCPGTASECRAQSAGRASASGL